MMIMKNAHSYGSMIVLASCLGFLGIFQVIMPSASLGGTVSTQVASAKSMLHLYVFCMQGRVYRMSSFVQL